LRLVVCPENLSGVIGREPVSYALTGQDEQLIKRSVDAEDLSDYAAEVTSVLVGYAPITDLDFLTGYPNVTEVWIRTSTIEDMSSLRDLTRLKRLILERPTGRLDILGDLTSLTDLRISDWRPGASALFRLPEVETLFVTRYPLPDLQPLRDWKNLRKLRLSRGALERLDGIPSTLINVEVVDARRLQSLDALRACELLQEVRVQGSRLVGALSGLENCLALKVLVLLRMGTIRTLDPLKELHNLEFISIADGTHVEAGGVDPLYELRALKTLNITRASRLDAARFRTMNPSCDLNMI
jgi:hypothetical protein